MDLDQVIQAGMLNGAGVTRPRNEPRRWRMWFGIVVSSSAAIVGIAYLLLKATGGDRLMTLEAVLIMLLAGATGAAGAAWRKAARATDALLLDAELRALAEQDKDEQLHTLQIEYRDIFVSHPAPMWIFDEGSLRIMAVNDAACAQYGYSRTEFLGMTILQLRAEADRETLTSYLAAPRGSLQRAGFWTHHRKDGTAIDVEICSHELAWRGRKVRLVTATDVTERLAADRRLKELNASLAAKVAERTQKVRRYAHRLRQRQRELEIVNRDLEMFSYSASHDLRTPLWVMGLFVDMLLKDTGDRLPADAVDQIKKIQVTARHMMALVDDLSKLAKVSKHAIRRSAVDISELAAVQVALLRERDPSRRVTVDITPGLQAYVDEGLLKIALENLIGNAWKYSGYVAEAEIRIGMEHREGEDVFFVQDNGAGFDMQDARDLFKPFHRMHGEDQFEGTGIGLAIVQRVIALHGGRVWAEAAQDKGATFYFCLGAEA